MPSNLIVNNKIIILIILVFVMIFPFCDKFAGKDSKNNIRESKGWTGNIIRVYSRDVDNGNTEIFAVDDAGNNRRLTHSPSRDEAPTLSPDKTKIAFNSNRDGEPAIYLMDIEGNIIRRLTNLRDINHLSRENRWKDSDQLIIWEVPGWRGYDSQRNIRIYQIHREYVNVITGVRSGIRVETYSEGTGQLFDVK